MRPEFLCERGVFPSAANCRVVTELVGKLDAEVAQAPNTLNCDKIAGDGAAMTECVECGDGGAQQWHRFSGVKPVGDARDGPTGATIYSAYPPSKLKLVIEPFSTAGATFVARNAGIFQPRPHAILNHVIAVANATACTLRRTWPGPGEGTSRSTSSRSPPALGTCTAFIFAMDVLRR